MMRAVDAADKLLSFIMVPLETRELLRRVVNLGIWEPSDHEAAEHELESALLAHLDEAQDAPRLRRVCQGVWASIDWIGGLSDIAACLPTEAIAVPGELVPLDDPRSEVGRYLGPELLGMVAGIVERDAFGDALSTRLRDLGYHLERRALWWHHGDRTLQGVIKLDPLGLFRAYVWASPRRESLSAEDMIAAMDAARDRNLGALLVVTRDDISDSARCIAEDSDLHVVILDGEALGELMLEGAADCGVEVRQGPGVTERLDLAACCG